MMDGTIASNLDKNRLWKWAKRQAIVEMELSWGARECWRILEGFPPGKCYPAHYHIAEKLHKSQSAVRRYLKELKQRGYIEITPQYEYRNARGSARTTPRGQTSNSYMVLDQPDLVARATQILQELQAKQQRLKG